MKKIILLIVLISLSLISFGQRANKGTLLINTVEFDPLFSAHTTANIINGTGFLKNNGSGTWTFVNASYEPLMANGLSWDYIRGDKTIAYLNSTVVPEGTNLYFTDARARAAISLTTVGTSGAATYTPATGVFNIPNYTAGFTDPMTTRGDIMYRNSSNVTARLPRGADTYILTSDGTDVRWAIPSNASLPLAANGTRGGVQIGYVSSDNDFALKLSSEKGYVSLPDASTTTRGIASFATSNFTTSYGYVTIKDAGITANNLANGTITPYKLSTYNAPSEGNSLTYNSYYDALTWTSITGLPSQATHSGKYLTTNGTTSSWATVSATPGGANTNVQYNNSGAFGGKADFAFNTSTNALSVSGTITASNFILSSDRRLKNNIQPIGNTKWVDDIHFKSFYMKNDLTGKIRYGVIAQELEYVNPNLVVTNEKGMKAVSYIDLLIAKATRQDEIINSLNIRIAKLENENNEKYFVIINGVKYSVTR